MLAAAAVGRCRAAAPCSRPAGRPRALPALAQAAAQAPRGHGHAAGREPGPLGLGGRVEAELVPAPGTGVGPGRANSAPAVGGRRRRQRQPGGLCGTQPCGSAARTPQSRNEGAGTWRGGSDSADGSRLAQRLGVCGLVKCLWRWRGWLPASDGAVALRCTLCLHAVLLSHWALQTPVGVLCWLEACWSRVLGLWANACLPSGPCACTRTSYQSRGCGPMHAGTCWRACARAPHELERFFALQARHLHQPVRRAGRQ